MLSAYSAIIEHLASAYYAPIICQATHKYTRNSGFRVSGGHGLKY